MPLSKTLTDIRAYIKARCGGDVVALEITDSTIDMFIKEALSVVSQYRGRRISATFQVSSRYGRVVFNRVIYPSTWKVGDPIPGPVPDDRVTTIYNVEQAESNKSTLNAIPIQSMYNPFGGTIFFVGGGYNINNYISGVLDLYINYTILDFSISAMSQIMGNVFDWMIDENQRNAAYYANLMDGVTFITVETLMEWDLDDYYVPPPDGSVSGTPAVLVTPKLSGNVLELTQKYALGLCQEAIGKVRMKLLGGSNSTQLDGQQMVSDGQTNMNEAKEELQTIVDYVGAYAT